MDKKRYPEPLPSETSLAYAAFMAYCDLSPFGAGTLKRSGNNVVEITGSSEGSVKRWSSEFAWVSRAQQFDALNNSNAIVAVMADLELARQKSVAGLGEELLGISQVLKKAIKHLLMKAEGGNVDVDELTAILKAVKLKDDLQRRMLDMPTSFRTDMTSEAESDLIERTYVIEG